MTDEELEARLRRLGGAPEKDAQFWDTMAADVRAAYARQAAATHAPPRSRRRRWIAAPAAALALAASLLVWQRVHHHPHATAVDVPLSADDLVPLGGDDDPAAMIDELDAAQLERVAQAFKKGA